jgi:Fic family protein
LKHQEHTIAIDSLGNTVKVPLLKGKFKEHPNNPQREDGTVLEYCPPIHVDTEIDNLLSIYNDLENRKIHPIILSSWFHHAFTQIHPFQDGNGRMARMLSSLILIKHHLFPLNILRNEKTEYIKALEKADNNQPNDLVKFFSKIQRRNIESALNIQTQPDTLKEVAEIFKEKVEKLNSRQQTERLKKLKRNRDLLTKFVYSIISNIQNELFNIIPIDKVYIDTNFSKENNNHYYTKQIIEYANQHNYFFNKNLERNWYRVSFIISKDKDKEKRYDIIISIHHFGYFDSVVAIGSFVEFIDSSYDNEKIKQTIPLNIKPYTISLENELSEYTKRNIEDYLRDIFKVGLTVIINEIS